MIQTLTPPRSAVTRISLNRASPFARDLLLWLPLGARQSYGSTVARDLSDRHRVGQLEMYAPSSGDTPPAYEIFKGRAAVRFVAQNGYNGDQIRVPDARVPAIGTGDFAFALWLAPEYTVGDARILLCTETPHIVQIAMTDTTLNLVLGSSQSSYDAYTTDIPFASGDWHTADLNTWHHVVFQRRNETMSIHVDGRAAPTTSGVSPDSTEAMPARTTWILGFRGLPAGWNQHPYFGRMADVRIYARSFSVSEIAQLYRETRGGGYGSLATEHRPMGRPAEGAESVAQSAPILLTANSAI